jgi:hypothetical protein
MYDYDDELDLNEFENYLEKDRSRAKRRHNDVSKALRKYNISKTHYGFLFLGAELHKYSKNKIHCSCPMCAVKTNTKMYKSRGPNSRDMSKVMSCRRYGKKNYKASDIRRIDEMLYEEQERKAI